MGAELELTAPASPSFTGFPSPSQSLSGPCSLKEGKILSIKDKELTIWVVKVGHRKDRRVMLLTSRHKKNMEF